MQIEAEDGVGASKGKHSKEMRTYFSETIVAGRYETRNDISFLSQAQEGRLYTLLSYSEEAIGGSFDGFDP